MIRFVIKFLFVGLLYYLFVSPAMAEVNTVIIKFNMDGRVVPIDVTDVRNQNMATRYLERAGLGICPKRANFAMDRLNARIHNVPMSDLVAEIAHAYEADTKRARQEKRDVMPHWPHYQELIRIVQGIYETGSDGEYLVPDDYGLVWGLEVQKCICDLTDCKFEE